MSKTAIDDPKRLEFLGALLALHKDIGAMKRTENNPFFKSKYVSLPVMLEQLEPVLEKHGFILSQPIDVTGAQTGIENCVFSSLIHVATGYSDVSKMVIPKLEDMQKLGGAVTYARRYTLSALLSLREVDDDGETAVGRGITKTPAKGKDKF